MFTAFNVRENHFGNTKMIHLISKIDHNVLFDDQIVWLLEWNVKEVKKVNIISFKKFEQFTIEK